MNALALLRLLRFAVHIAAGLLTVLLLFPHLNGEERGRRVSAWARKLLAIFKVRLRVVGRPPAIRGEGALVVSNHVSWLDIYLLHSLLHTRFVSKAEVRAWPIIGWLAAGVGTLFLERAKKSDAHRINQEMTDLLAQGASLALFPEGTTTDGTRLLPFYPTLFQPAVAAQARVWPVLIRYLHAEGEVNLDAAYCDDITMAQSLKRIVKQGTIHAQVHFLPPIASAGLHRRELASQAQAAIRAALEHDARGSRPARSPHPRAVAH